MDGPSRGRGLSVAGQGGYGVSPRPLCGIGARRWLTCRGNSHGRGNNTTPTSILVLPCRQSNFGATGEVEGVEVIYASTKIGVNKGDVTIVGVKEKRKIQNKK